MIFDYKLQELRRKQHLEENKEGDSSGEVTRAMIEAAELKEKNKRDSDITYKDVYEFLRDESLKYNMRNPAPIHSHEIEKLKDKKEHAKKLNLSLLVHYLANEPLPGFDSPIDEPSIHLMFEEWEGLRDHGISAANFKSLIQRAETADSGDYMNKRNTFAFLLSEENIRYRGFVFDKFHVTPMDAPPTCPNIYASLILTTFEAVVNNPKVKAANMKKTFSVLPPVDMSTYEPSFYHHGVSSDTSNQHNMDPEIEVIDTDLANPKTTEEKEGSENHSVVGGISVVQNADSKNVSDAQTRIDDNGDTDDKALDVNAQPVPPPQQEAGLHNLFGLW